MNNNTLHTFFTVAIVSGITILLRSFAFMAFPQGKKIPPFIENLGNVLPYGIMAFLVIYCLKDMSFVSYPYGIPELLSVAVVSLLQIWKKNSLLSVLAGTISYMLLVQVVFS